MSRLPKQHGINISPEPQKQLFQPAKKQFAERATKASPAVPEGCAQRRTCWRNERSYTRSPVGMVFSPLSRTICRTTTAALAYRSVAAVIHRRPLARIHRRRASPPAHRCSTETGLWGLRPLHTTPKEQAPSPFRFPTAQGSRCDDPRPRPGILLVDSSIPWSGVLPYLLRYVTPHRERSVATMILAASGQMVQNQTVPAQEHVLRAEWMMLPAAASMPTITASGS